MAKKAARPSKLKSKDCLIDVTVIFLSDGYASTAIAPIEIFHSAGRLWGWLRGEEQRPRFRVRTATVDGKPVYSIGAYRLVPEFALSEVKKTDIIILSATGWALEE